MRAVLASVVVATILAACNAIVGNDSRDVEEVVDASPETSVAKRTPFADARPRDVVTPEPGDATPDADPADARDTGRCPARASVFDDPATGHCYELVLTPRTWQQAEVACQRLTGHLAAVTSDAERQRIMTALGGSAPKMWIGARDSADEGTFTWSTGEPFAFAAWIRGEPNNDSNEDCVNVKPDQSWGWNDASCAEMNAFLCEF